MAYTKQTWTDDVSAVTGARMTHIEQGIYDNSLATDKINPSGTATTTAEIEEGQITDVIGFKSLKLKGQTSQYTTTGKNKLSLTIENKTTGGITLTRNNDNSYKISGTSTSLLLFTSSNTQTLTANTTYTLGITNGNNNVQLSLRTSDGNTQYVKTEGTATYATFTPTTDIEVKLYVRVPSGVTVNETIYPMVVEGSTIGTYEPYTGGKASPNPDFPQDVNNVSGDNVVEISNKNLLKTKLPTTTQSGVTLTNNGDGTYTLNGTNSSSGTITFRINQSDGVASNLQDYEDGAYTLDLGVAIPNVQMCLTQNTTYTNFLVTGYGVRLKSGTLSNATNTFIYIAIRTGTTINNVIIRPMLVKGTYTTSTIPSFVAHQGNDFDIDLPVENKLPYPYVDTTKTNNGITYTDLGDGRIKVNGTATANSAFALYGTASSQITLNANYVYGGVNSNVRVRVMNRSSSGTYTTLGNSIGTSTQIDRSTVSTGYVEISIASGTTVNNLIITPMLSENEVNAFTPYNENPIELCKISTYEDYIYKKDGKWFVHKEFEKLILKDMNWFLADNTGLSNTVSHRWAVNHPCARITNNNMKVTMSNIVPMGSANITWGQDVLSIGQSVSQLVIRMPVEYTTEEAMKTALAELNAVGYALLGTPIEEEITYAPLIRQLDELYNSGLYDNTNISQDNSSEAFILDMEACKNNINGIVEYIRR